MARTLFPDILAAYTVDIKNEIRKIYRIFFVEEYDVGTYYSPYSSSIYKFCEESFLFYRHRGIILSLKEFDKKFGFDKFYNISNCSDGEELDYLIDFCEYVYNLLSNITFKNEKIEAYSRFVINHIKKLCESLNHVIHNTGDGMYFIVPSNGVIDYVCEKMGNDVTQLIRVYSHKTTKGNLAIKQQILSTLCKELEPYRKDLSKFEMKKTVDNVFYGANNCDVRHKNTDQEGKNYCANFAGLTEEERESIYDNMFENIIVLLSAMIGSEAIDELNGEIAGIKKKIALRND